ncbi:MAG: triose-phosphate isomerase [Gemmataceae bacterium]|nr:triose-phosphate isomerase [Gemmataceae bacterium]
MTKRPKFVAGNWKMYTSRAGAKELAAAVAQGAPAGVQVAVFPPSVWLTAVADALAGSSVGLGAQNCHFEKEGAFTGELAPQMLLEAGCRYTLVGHSERRHGLGETDDFLNKKAKAALAVGLHVIFCVGELLAEREANRTDAVLEKQLTDGLSGIPAEHLPNLVIAYEPVWAIGTGKVATPEQAQAAHAFIRRKFAALFGEKSASALLIQYGGSVKPENAADLLHQSDVDGALVGGASLKAESFLGIVRAAV